MVIYPKTKSQIVSEYNEFIAIEKTLSFLSNDEAEELTYRYGFEQLYEVINCDFRKPNFGFYDPMSVSQAQNDIFTFCERHKKEIRRFQMLRQNASEVDRFDALAKRVLNQFRSPSTFETISHTTINSGEIDVFTILKRSAYSEHSREQQQIFEIYDVDIVIFDKDKEKSLCWMSGEAHGACFDHDVDEQFYRNHINTIGDDYSIRAADMLCHQIRFRGEFLSDYFFSYEYLAHTLTCHIHMVRIRDANKRMEFGANATPMDIFVLAEANFKNNEHAIDVINRALKGISSLDIALCSGRELNTDLFHNINKRIALTESNMIPYIGFSIIAINQCVIYQGHPFSIENELMSKFDNKIHTTRTMDILDRITNMGNDVKSFHHVTL